MSTKQERERHEDREQQERDGRNARIRQGVIESLRSKEGLQLVQVRALWGNHFRVNVFLGSDATTTRIAHSYFVEADAAGNILESTPKIGA